MVQEHDGARGHDRAAAGHGQGLGPGDQGQQRHGSARSGAAGARQRGDVGMATAEYAVGTLAAVGFAGLLFAVLRSGEVQELLLELVRRALGSV